MCDYLKVSYNGTVVQVPLIYRVTVFMSTSGEGKTYFIDSSIESFVDDSEDKVLTVECEKKLLFFSDKSDIKTFTEIYEKHEDVYYVMDEEFARHFFEIIKNSYDKFIIVSRSKFLLNFVDIRSIYTLVFNRESFMCSNAFKIVPPEGKPDLFIVESHERKSEHLFIETCMPEVLPIVSGFGRNKLCDVLSTILDRNANIKKVFLAFDLGAGASNYQRFVDIQNYYGINIYVFPYVCFESILFYSKLVQSITKDIDIDKINAFSSEKYYEKLLEVRTYGTKLASKHAEFSSCFLKDCADCCEYSQPSLLLKTLFSEEGLPLLKWYWNTYHPEWVPLTDTVIEKLKTLYNPKGFDKSKYSIKE